VLTLYTLSLSLSVARSLDGVAAVAVAARRFEVLIVEASQTTQLHNIDVI
jgi:transcriptional antiterminator Rof (Rho-off)